MLDLSREGVRNWVRYGSFYLPVQVDERVLEPICKEAFGSLSYFVHHDDSNILSPPEDFVFVNTRSADSAKISYYSSHDERYGVTARIFIPTTAQHPFGDSCYMEIDGSHLDDELVDALEKIVRECQIPRITATPGSLEMYNNARLLMQSPYFIFRE